MALFTLKIMWPAARDPPLRALWFQMADTKRRAQHKAENIRQHGVLQPVLVRPLPEGEAGTYELVAGARRFRASKIAKRESIPATVRELTDAQALELQVIENVQRVDVHPLDEAQGYAALIQLQPNTYTVERIAAPQTRAKELGAAKSG